MCFPLKVNLVEKVYLFDFCSALLNTLHWEKAEPSAGRGQDRFLRFGQALAFVHLRRANETRQRVFRWRRGRTLRVRCFLEAA